MYSVVRQRAPASSFGGKGKLTRDSLLKEQRKEIKQVDYVVPWYLIGLFVLLFALMCSTAIYFYWKLPDVINHDDPNEFLVANARKHLIDITNIGIRHVGSDANEVLARQLLLKKLKKIQSGASDKVVIEISEQLVSGHYYLSFLGGMTHLYQNITNIVAKFYTKGTNPEHAFLVNAHYDSALGSIAASDDAVSCSTMLEVLRCLSSDPDPLLSKHALIFLFNGAEETILQASHGFITKHQWSKEIRAFLNLEAAGAGGREIVFQTGPDHPWLARLYAKSVPHPHASIVAQEIFQAGVIPSDTDFRVFRDHGHIPGIDTAYFVNGYVYHTEYDVPSAIPDGSIQRAGDNVLALLREVSNSRMLSHPEDEDKYGKVIFFDIMGLMTVVFEEKVAVFVNVAAAIGVLLTIYFGTKSSARTGIDNPTLGLMFKTLSVMLLSLVASIITTVTIAMLLTVPLDRSMTWYAYPIMILALYVIPSFLTVAGLHMYWTYKNDGAVSKLTLEKSCFLSSQLLWAIVLLILTSLRICSAFLFFVAVFFPLVFRSILFDLLIGSELRKSTDKSMYGVAYIVSMAFSCGLPMMLGVQLIIGLIEMFIPLMGRSGSLLPPDLAVAVITACMVWYNVPHMMCVLVYASSAQLKRIVGVLLLMVFALGLIVSATGYVPPYSMSDPSYPRPKRYFLQHTERTFHGIDGTVKRTDSLIMINSFDYLGIKPIADATPAFRDAKLLDCEGLYCSEPFYIPVKHLTKNAWYILAPKLQWLESPKLKVLSESSTSDHSRNFTFQAEFPNRCSVFIAPTDGHVMSSWSLENYVPPVTPCPGYYSNTGCYFVFYARGRGDGNFQFWIEIETTDGSHSDAGSIDIAVAAHYLDPPMSNTPFLNELMKDLPDWVTTIAWTSKYSSWTF